MENALQEQRNIFLLIEAKCRENGFRLLSVQKTTKKQSENIIVVHIHIHYGNEYGEINKRLKMAKKRIVVIKESSTGRNERFRDTKTNEQMSRCELVKKIELGKYPNYHLRNVHGKKTPVSNPDSTTDNNLD